LLQYAWPRNVRELEKCLSRASVLAGGGSIEPGHLPKEVREGTRESRLPARASGTETEDVRARVVALLTEHRGNLAAVATAMGTSRSQVHRWLQRFAIDAATYRG
jgi:transcriptional regulator of acetoin/glycerol metabolism